MIKTIIKSFDIEESEMIAREPTINDKYIFGFSYMCYRFYKCRYISAYCSCGFGYYDKLNIQRHQLPRCSIKCQFDAASCTIVDNSSMFSGKYHIRAKLSLRNGPLNIPFFFLAYTHRLLSFFLFTRLFHFFYPAIFLHRSSFQTDCKIRSQNKAGKMQKIQLTFSHFTVTVTNYDI